jgi:tetratricopeptide (TPR) repeat protein
VGEEGDHKRSAAVLSRAIFLDPANPSLFRLRARACLNLRDFAAAIANLRKTVSLCPSEGEGLAPTLADAHFRLGEELVASGNHEAALGEFTAASELCPTERDYIMRRLECLLRLGRGEQCLNLVEKELKQGLPTPELHLMHAKISLSFEKVNRQFF